MFHAVWVIASVWLIICSIHALLSSCQSTSQAYHNFLNRHGLFISLGHFKVYWSGCHAWIHRLGALPGLRLWFDIGSAVSCVLLVLSLPLLATLLAKSLYQPAEEQILKPVIPGVNVPWSQMVYVALSIFVCAVLHELGHAVAAIREQVRVDGYGVFIFLIYPGAFVDVHDEHMAAISPRRRMRIYAAGVWHNFVIAVLGGLLFLATPYLMSPLFLVGHGVEVLNVVEHSAFYGQLPAGTHITQINGCPVTSLGNVHECLNRIYGGNLGYCISLDYIVKQQRLQQHDAPFAVTAQLARDCCGESSSHICFSYESSQGHQGHICLRARNVTTGTACRYARHCLASFPEGSGLPACIKPNLEVTSRLLRIHHSMGTDVMYEGNPYLLLYEVHLSNYIPRWPWISLLNKLPLFLEASGLYLLSISSALCFLNVIPVYYLDGHWVLVTLIDLVLPTYIPNQRARNKIAHSFLIAGSLLLVANFAVAIVGAVL